LFMLKLLTFSEKKIMEWGIPSQELENLESLYADFVQAFNAACAAPSSSTFLARQKTQVKVTEALEQFIEGFLLFPPVTDSDRDQMGI